MLPTSSTCPLKLQTDTNTLRQAKMISRLAVYSTNSTTSKRIFANEMRAEVRWASLPSLLTTWHRARESRLSGIPFQFPVHELDLFHKLCIVPIDDVCLVSLGK